MEDKELVKAYRKGLREERERILKLIDEMFDKSKFKTYCNWQTWLEIDIKELKERILGA